MSIKKNSLTAWQTTSSLQHLNSVLSVSISSGLHSTPQSSTQHTKFKLGEPEYCNREVTEVTAHTDGGISLYLDQDRQNCYPVFGVEVTTSPEKYFDKTGDTRTKNRNAQLQNHAAQIDAEMLAQVCHKDNMSKT